MKKASFTVICDKCGERDVFIAGCYDGDYMISCQKCDNVGSESDGDLILNGE